jgi:PKD repeat protein
MRKLLIVLIGLALVAGLVMSLSCTDGSDDAETDYGSDTKFEVVGGDFTVPHVKIPPASGPPGTSVTISGSGYAPQGHNFIDDDYGEFTATNRMIVRTGNMNLKVSNVAETLEQIKAITQSLGGYVVHSDWQGGERENTASISIRVPTAEYDAATMSLRDLAIEVLYESTYAEDVTEEYTDLDAQLRNLEATESRYLELLEKAETVEDMLNVEEKLSETRGRIEHIQGRMKYLEQTSATSLISIFLVEEAPLEADFEVNKIKVETGKSVIFTNKTTGGSSPYGYTWDFGDGDEATETKEDYITVVGESGWSAGDIVEGAWNGLVGIGHFLAHVVIWVGVLSIIWVPIVLIVLGMRWRRKQAS